MIKIFRGGGGGGGSSERCLKWGGGWSLRGLSIIKQGWVKAKIVFRGGGFEGVTTPAPRKILIIHMPPHVFLE